MSESPFSVLNSERKKERQASLSVCVVSVTCMNVRSIVTISLTPSTMTTKRVTLKTCHVIFGTTKWNVKLFKIVQ